MGKTVSKNFGSHSFAESAMLQARNISAARSDLAYFIFPKNSFPVDEHLIASVKNSLYMMVFNIERAILRHSVMHDRIEDTSLSYPMLAEAGLLNNNKILDTALSLFHYQKLSKNSDINIEFSDKLMNHEDLGVKNCVQILLLAHSRFHSLGLGNYFELPPEVMQNLVWQIVATFEIIDGYIEPALIEGTSQWLQSYSEANTIAVASRKLVYLLRNENLQEYWKFEPASSALFIALLERNTSLDRDIIINILADKSPILCALLFRAVDMELSHAIDNIMRIYYCYDDSNYNQFISQIYDEYLNISPSEAQDKIIYWSTASITGGPDA